MIIFNSILIEGFGSIRDQLSFDLNSSGINIIKGPNGSGKTTLFSAVLWTLYQTNLKGVTLSKLETREGLRTDSYRGCRTVLSIEKDDVDYTIARHINFKGDTLGYKGNSDLLIFENGSLMNFQHKADSQNFIENILLGIDSKSFLNSIIFGQNMTRFIEASPQEKRSLFEEIVDLTFLDEAKAKAIEKQIETQNKIYDLDNSITEAEGLIEVNSDKAELIREQIENFEANKTSKIEIEKDKLQAENLMHDNYVKEVDEYTKKVSSLKKALVKIDNVKLEQKAADLIEQRLDITNLKNSLDNKVVEAETALKYLKEPDKPELVCPTCDRKLTKSLVVKLQEDYEEALSEYTNKFEELHDDLATYRAELHETYSELQKLVDKEKEANEDLEKYLRFEKDIEQYNNLIATAQTKITFSQSSIQEREARIKALSEEELDIESPKVYEELASNLTKVIKDIEEEREPLAQEAEIYQWWSDVGFSNKGMKGFLFNSALQLLNNAVAKYGDRLGVRIHFSIDTSKKSKPFVTNCYLGGSESSYEEFSGGEQARLDIATAFAMHDLISSNTQFNILVMDELFEGLDNEGIDTVFDLIRTKTEDRSLFIITHSEHLDALNTKRIEFSKINNTTIVQ